MLFRRPYVHTIYVALKPYLALPVLALIPHTIKAPGLIYYGSVPSFCNKSMLENRDLATKRFYLVKKLFFLKL